MIKGIWPRSSAGPMPMGTQHPEGIFEGAAPRLGARIKEDQGTRDKLDEGEKDQP